MRAAWVVVVASLFQNAGLWAQPKGTWKSVYFHDEDDSSLALHELRFGSPDCGIALGVLANRGRVRHVSLVTRDAGVTWKLVPLDKYGRSVQFVNAALGFMVTEEGVTRTRDCGQSWERVSKEKNLARVHFLDESRGLAVGAPKKVLQTKDGGKSWSKVAAAAEPKSNPDRSIYSWIDFDKSGNGIIVGWHEPDRPDRERLPPWLDPERAQRRRQWPSLTLVLQSSDGGEHWVAAASSIMGKVSRVRLNPPGPSLAVVEFDAGFEWPSEVYRIQGGKTERAFRQRDRLVTDAAFDSSGLAYLGAVESNSAVRLPIPGKVRILASRDLERWEEMTVDYRAVAQRVMLAAASGGAVFAATDTGMILKLTP